MEDYGMIAFLYKITVQDQDRGDRLEVERCRTCLEDVILNTTNKPLLVVAYEHLDKIDLEQGNLY